MNDENTRFKEEVLKNIKKFEDNIIKQIDEKMVNLNIDYQKFHEDLDNLTEKNKKLIESLTNKNLNFEKIAVLEKFKSKVDSILITHEIRINNNIEEISSIKSKYGKTISENLLVPGYVGPSCQYKNIGEYVMYSLSELSKMKSEKEMIRNSFKELKIKTESSIKMLLNLNESLVRRCNDYADTRVSEYKTLLYDKLDYLETKEKEIKNIVKYFKEEQEFYEKNKNNFANDLKEKILSHVDTKINEFKNKQEDIINKYLSENRSFLENYVNKIFENKIKDIKDNIKGIQNKIISIYNDNNLSSDKKIIQESKNDRNFVNFPLVPSLSQRVISVLSQEKKEEQNNNTNITNNNEYNENILTFSNYNDYNDTYKPNYTYSNFNNTNLIKKAESSFINYYLNNKQLNSESKLISSQNNIIKNNFKENQEKLYETQKNNNMEKSEENTNAIYKKKETSDIIIRHKNSKLLIFNYGHKNHLTNSIQKTKINIKKSKSNKLNNNELMNNIVNNKDNINNNNKDSELIDCGIEEEKFPKTLFDELQNPQILEKRILSNEELKINQDKIHNLNMKINFKNNLNRSGTDLNRLLAKYQKNFSPKHKINPFKTLDSWKKNSKNWKSERNIKLNKDKNNYYNMIQLEFKSEANVTNGATVIASKKTMNQHVTKMGYPNSFASMYNVKIINKNPVKS